MYRLSSNTVYLLKKKVPEIFLEITSGAIVLMMDASYLALEGGKIQEKIDKGMDVYVLEDDVIRRGILNMLIHKVKVINYEEFVDLVLDLKTKTLNL